MFDHKGKLFFTVVRHPATLPIVHDSEKMPKHLSNVLAFFAITVTRWVGKKVAQNIALPIFVKTN
jgi:hypothetical protein